MSKIKTGDLVKVIAGADRGKQGSVIAVDREGGRVRVEGIRMQKHHLKPGRRGAQQGGIVEQEGYVSEDQDGKRVRVFARGGQPVPDAAP